jgi:biofilm PGA synthesis N-glycosyltransferase PgaC
VQSLYHGVLVAQGAFSLYDTATLRAMGGWPDAIGEDIVLTWAMLDAGYRVGHAEDACAFTSVPATLARFVAQRRRWSRGMIEAFGRTPGIIWKPRLSTMFILWNTLFPLLDVAYVCAFMPGVVLACFGHFWIAGPMTLALLPIGFAMNFFMFRVESRMFALEGLKVRRNPWGFVVYILAYGFVLQPASVMGYVSELFNMRKTWGTK